MIAAYIPVFFLQETYLKIILARRKEKQDAVANPEAKPPCLDTTPRLSLHHATEAYEDAFDRTNRYLPQSLRGVQFRCALYVLWKHSVCLRERLPFQPRRDWIGLPRDWNGLYIVDTDPRNA